MVYSYKHFYPEYTPFQYENDKKVVQNSTFNILVTAVTSLRYNRDETLFCPLRGLVAADTR